MKKSALRLVPPNHKVQTVDMARRRPNAELRAREYLTEAEVEKLIDAARGNRWGHRDATMILVAFRHGLRVGELIDLRWDQIEFESARCMPQGQQWHPSVHPTSCGLYVVSRASRIRNLRSCSRPNAADRSLCRRFNERWRAPVRPQSSDLPHTRTCCDMPVATR
jgi:integrase